MKLFLLAPLAVGLIANVVGAQITYVGSASIPGTALDHSRLAGNIVSNAGVDSGLPNAVFGGAGSAIDYTGADNVYLMAPDRGPNNGDARVADRVQYVRIVVEPRASSPVSVALVDTTLLLNAAGHGYTGSSAAFATAPGAETLRLDPEGIRLAHDPAAPGAFWLSDEYGPYILKFDKFGHNIASFQLPQKYISPAPSPNAEQELAAKTGRQPNRGMEGLAISPDGTTLTGLMQNALIQDHALDAKGKRISEFTRLITIHLPTREIHEFAYPLDAGTFGTNEILAINDHQFLVIERDGKAGADSASKKIYRANIAGATDISRPFTADGKHFDYSATTTLNGLPTKGPVPGLTPVAKTLFLDLLDPKWGLRGNQFPEKIEGLAWGPDFDNGDKLLVITSDNDFKPDEPTFFYAFRVAAPVLTARVEPR